MKRYALMAITVILMTISLPAQGKGGRLSREELAVKQAKHISKELAFDTATAAKFKETYCNYQKEVWALGPSLGKDSSGTKMEERFDRSQKILDLRRKYYDIYSTFLTQEQISRVYELERQMMRRLSGHKGQAGRKRVRR